MKRMISRRSWIVFAFVVAAACFLTLGAWARGFRRTNNPPQGQKHLTLVNKTNSLTVTKAELEPNGRTIRLSVQNSAKKPIDWFRISLGQGSDVEADFAYTEKAFLAPGESYEDSYPVDSQGENLNITIVSVVFEDTTSDGDVRFAQRLINKRHGQAIELKRLLPLINEITNAPSKERRDALVGTLESRIAEGAIDSSLPEATQEGVTIARERVLENIRRTKNSADTATERWRKLAAGYERISLKLKQYSL